MKSKRVEFRLPEGFSTPEGMTVGEDFDAVSTYRIKADGNVCLVMLGDTKMPGYDDKDASGGERPDYSEAAKKMASSGMNDNDGDET